MNPDMHEIRNLRYRQEVVARWPNSSYKEAVLTAIETRLLVLTSGPRIPAPAGGMSVY